MLKISKILSLILLLSGVLCSAFVTAQPNSIGWKDYSYIQHSKAWLTSENAAGLKELIVNDISLAEIHFTKGNGKFINYNQSDNNYEIGANVESFYRFNPKIVFFGKVSYNNFQGKNMGASAFINSERAPFDIVEYTDDERGKKKLETYHLIGAVSVDVYKGIILGGKIDFISANYSKYKDLRHKNKLSDMFVTTGLSYKINNKFDIGANYYYQRKTEGLEFATYGTTDKRYQSLISYGIFYGKTETFGETGYTAKSSEKPLFDKYHGGALQLKVNFTSEVDLFNEISYKKRNGYYGVSSTSGIIYSEHNSKLYTYKGKLNLKHKRNLHSLDVDLNNEKLENLENVYKEEKPQGSSTSIITYYDPLKVGVKEIFNAKLEYIANLGINDFNPTWVLKGGLNLYSKKQTASVYPYYRKQTIRQTSFNLFGNRNIVKGNNMYSIMLDLNYATGSGTPKNDGLYATPGENHIQPLNSDTYLFREYEYLTCDQIKGDIGFRFSRLFSNIGIKGYASANYSLTKAFDTAYIDGDSFNMVNIAIGCNF